MKNNLNELDFETSPRSLEDFINNAYGVKSYYYMPSQDSNGYDKTDYEVGEDIYTLDETDLSTIEDFKTGKYVEMECMTYLLLSDLCKAGKIKPGEYSVE